MFSRNAHNNIMIFNFDLISDLFLTNLDDFSWEGKATSLFCIVAGNISSDHEVLFNFLEGVSQYYEGVFFIDGYLEHDAQNGDFDCSYASLRENIEAMESVFFLHEKIIVLPDVTLLSTNGWTTFDFTDGDTTSNTLDFLNDKGQMSYNMASKIFKLAVSDQHYMHNSIEDCQKLDEVKNIIVVTSSVPSPDLINHDEAYNSTILGDTAGNSGILSCLLNDDQTKVKTWIFGRYNGEIDLEVDGVRFVNNPGCIKDPDNYYPKIIKP